MAYAILRAAKLKSDNLSGCSQHLSRSRDTPNANPEMRMNNQVLIGTENMKSDVMNHIEEAGASFRSNSVMAVELLLTASPEYFRPDESDRYGFYETDATKQWGEKVMQWLSDQPWADHVVNVQLHLDEATPHMHAVVVPVNEKTGRLSAREIITGGRDKLRGLQDSYAAAMEPLGLERGEPGSRARHEDIAKLYGVITGVQKSPNKIEPKKVLGVTVESKKSLDERQAEADLEYQRLSAYRKSKKAKEEVARMKDLVDDVKDQNTALNQKVARLAEDLMKYKDKGKKYLSLERKVNRAGLDIKDLERWIDMKMKEKNKDRDKGFGLDL